MKKNLNVYLTDILRAAADVQTYTVDASFEDLMMDKLLQDAVLYKLAVIGEVVARLPVHMRDAHPQIPWQKIVGMRNLVIHDYSDVDIRTVWDTIKRDLPELVQMTQKILKQPS